MIEDMNPTFEAVLKPPTAESPGDLTQVPSACKRGSWQERDEGRFPFTVPHTQGLSPRDHRVRVNSEFPPNSDSMEQG